MRLSILLAALVALSIVAFAGSTVDLVHAQCTMSGRVIDASTRAGIGGANVTDNGGIVNPDAWTLTNSSGYFVLHQGDAYDWAQLLVTASAQGYDSYSTNASCSAPGENAGVIALYRTGTAPTPPKPVPWNEAVLSSPLFYAILGAYVAWMGLMGSLALHRRDKIGKEGRPVIGFVIVCSLIGVPGAIVSLLNPAFLILMIPIAIGFMLAFGIWASRKGYVDFRYAVKHSVKTGVRQPAESSEAPDPLREWDKRWTDWQRQQDEERDRERERERKSG